MKSKGNCKKPKDARHQRHLWTKFNNKPFWQFCGCFRYLDTLDTFQGCCNPASFSIQLDSILFMASFYMKIVDYCLNINFRSQKRRPPPSPLNPKPLKKPLQQKKSKSQKWQQLRMAITALQRPMVTTRTVMGLLPPPKNPVWPLSPKRSAQMAQLLLLLQMIMKKLKPKSLNRTEW